MYRCHIHFYLAGCSNKVFEYTRKLSPMEHFTHEFTESVRVEKGLAQEADVILANIRGLDEAAVKKVMGILLEESVDAQIILLADREQIGELADGLHRIRDIWMGDMSDEEIRFRLGRWQEAFRQEKDFWETKHFLDAAINNTPNLIWYKDKNGIHEKVNDSFCRTVNKTRQQVEGQGHAYIWDVEQDDPACIESENEVMRSRKTCVAEEVIQTGDGMRTLTTYKSPLYDLDGSVMGTVGVGIDVTQERAYEQEIVQKNRTLEMIFTTIDCGVIRHTLDGSRVLSINRAALRILGYESMGELERDGFSMVASTVVEEDQPRLKACIRELKKEGDSVSVEYRVRHKNGTLLHVMGNIKLLMEDGELVCQRFLLDCTEQKRQERKNEKRHRDLIQALGIDYYLVCSFDLDTGRGLSLRNEDHKGHIFDPIFTGEISLEESMEQYIQQSVYEEDRLLLRRAVSLERLRDELAEKKLLYANFRVTKEDRTEYLQMKVVRVGNWDKNYGIVLGFRSVDEEIRSEMEQKSLLEDALLRANKASKAKSVFLSNMSHDIRTPMNAIVGFTSLALTHIDRQEQVEGYLKKIMSSGNHLLSLINDVLDMSRIESGKIQLEEKSCSLPEILHGLRNILQADVHAKQLELNMDALDVWNEKIYCDKLRLNQVLLNLLSNSVKYTVAGGSVSLRVTEKTGAPKGYADYEFYIKDTGIGMSEEFVSHIFEPFERERSSTLSGIPGTGLGMSITKNIVDMMHGSIDVKSKQGVGTEFTVSFRFRLDEEEKGPQEIPELKNCRALVVDDDFNSCDSVSCMLGQLGLRAEWTMSGKEAVLRNRQAAMHGDDYGVYVIDWLLPDMNGVEVVRRIRKETGGNAPVIVLTAYDWSEIEEEAREAGVSAFCSKPLFMSELRKCLSRVLGSGEEEEGRRESPAERFKGGRILLAEDNELNQEIAVAILGEAGFTTEVAANGQIAVEMLEKSVPGYYRVVLMDVQMPVMNGYEATKKIRGLEEPGLASIPIIAMTANAFEEDKREALASGMNGHIAKPINVENLFDTLEEILSEEDASQ